jgi:hypothetical protein
MGVHAVDFTPKVRPLLGTLRLDHGTSNDQSACACTCHSGSEFSLRDILSAILSISLIGILYRFAESWAARRIRCAV